MTRRDWNLLVLSMAEGQKFSPVQLQKSLFLLEKNLASSLLGPDFYHFVPYHYGPFDSRAYQDAEALAHDGLAVVVDPPNGYAEYAATPTGIEVASRIKKELPGDVVEYVRKVVEWVRGQSFTSLVKSIYKAYPDMKENSVFTN